MTDSSDRFQLEDKKQYFEKRLKDHGATPRGVDWNSDTAQDVRFAQLSRICPSDTRFSLLDYGCGYGALYDYLRRVDLPIGTYLGYDLLESMAQQGRAQHPDQPAMTFTANLADLTPQDYLIASGIFNIKLDTPTSDWTLYVLQELEKMNALAVRGFSFNMLTSYSDADHMRPDLYYANPCEIFDYCKRHFSRNVALLHDYEVYDFTILVRKAP